jgi:hypothetical protein
VVLPLHPVSDQSQLLPAPVPVPARTLILVIPTIRCAEMSTVVGMAVKKIPEYLVLSHIITVVVPVADGRKTNITRGCQWNLYLYLRVRTRIMRMLNLHRCTTITDMKVTRVMMGTVCILDMMDTKAMTMDMVTLSLIINR